MIKKIVIGIVVVAVVAVALFVSGVFGGGDETARPACEDLPTRESAEQAVAQNADLVAKIEAVGPTVAVMAAQPCGDQGKGLVRVTYATSGDRAEIEEVLNAEDGFGVPVEVVETD